MNPRYFAPVCLSALVFLSGCGSSYVEQGYVGLLIDNISGKIDKVLDPGFRLAIPIGQHIVKFPVIKQQYVMVRGKEGQRADEDDSINVNSQEGQSFNVEASVEYAIRDKTVVAALYQRYGMDWDNIVEKYYRSKFRAGFTNAFASLPLAMAITGSGRLQVEKMAQDYLKKALADDGITVHQVMIRAVFVPEAISNSIAEKTKAENDLVRARTVAQQQVVEAEAEAKARLIKAQAEAKANHLVASSLTPQLIQKLYVEKLSDKISLVVPNNSFFNFGGIVPPPAQAR